MAAKKPTNIQAYEAARQLIAHVNWMEDNRFLIRDVLLTDSSTADNVLSALGRMSFEMGQVFLVVRDHRRTRASGA